MNNDSNVADLRGQEFDENQRSLVDIAREAVEPYGGFELELPTRDEIRDVQTSSNPSLQR